MRWPPIGSSMGAASSAATPGPAQWRQFGLLIGTVFPVVFGWLLPSLRGHALPWWPFVIGLPALLLALVAPKLLDRPYRGWMALGHALGWVNGHLILGLLHLLVLQPLALIMRLLGHDPLNKRWNAAQTTYRQQPHQSMVNLRRPF